MTRFSLGLDLLILSLCIFIIHSVWHALAQPVIIFVVCAIPLFWVTHELITFLASSVRDRMNQ